MEIDLTSKASTDEIRAALAQHISYLITHDFNKLVALLYRIDISERLLKINLETEERDAGAIIAEMIIERQIQKTRTKQQYKSKGDIGTDERW